MAKKVKGSRLADDLRASLDELRDFVAGKKTGAVVHRIFPSQSDAREARHKLGLSQREFASLVGAAVGTVRKWELRYAPPVWRCAHIDRSHQERAESRSPRDRQEKFGGVKPIYVDADACPSASLSRIWIIRRAAARLSAGRRRIARGAEPAAEAKDRRHRARCWP